MKKIIIIVFTIVLGMYIGNTLITGNGNTSLKSGANTVIEAGITSIDAID